MMNGILRRLGGWLMKNRLPVLIIWALALAAGAFFAPKVDDVLMGSAHLTGTDSETVSQILQKDFGNRYGNEFVIVFHSATRKYGDVAFNDAVSAIQLNLRGCKDINSITTYYDTSSSDLMGKDGHSILGVIELDVPDSNAAQRAVAGIRNAVTPHKPAWMDVYIVGEGSVFYDLSHAGRKDLERAESNSFPIVVMVLIFTFGALLAAGIPVALGIMAVAIALAIVYFAGLHFPIHINAKNTVSMIGLGVGIDYSLFMVSRFREELKRGLSPRDAAVAIMPTSGKTVLFSGTTVIVGLLAVFLSGFQMTNSLAFAAIVVVIAAICVALTLLPVILSLLGPAINWPFSLAQFISRAKSGRMWHRIAMAVMRHPVLFFIITVTLFLGLASPLWRIKTFTPTVAGLPRGTESAQGFEQLKRDFVAGKMTPINIIIGAPQGQSIWAADSITRIYRLSRALGSDRRVSKVEGIVDIDPKLTLRDYLKLYSNQSREVSDNIFTQMVGSYVDPHDRETIMRVITVAEPGSFPAREVVKEIRSDFGPRIFGNQGYRVLVGGGSAFEVDLDQILLGKLPLIIGTVCLIVFVILMILFRSLLIPFKSILMNLLSVMTSFGLLVAVFQYGVLERFLGIRAIGGVSSMVLVLLFATLFGLSMDYEIFLTARMKEEHDNGHSNEESVALGLERTAGLVTSAALIMVTVFGAFVFTSMPTIQELGFGMAVAVFLDASLIRVLLMPAMMRLMGEWNWWFPKRISQIVPQIDIRE